MRFAVAGNGQGVLEDVGERRRVESEGDGGEERGDGGGGGVGYDAGIGEGKESQIRVGRAMPSGQDSGGSGGDESERGILSRVRSLVVRDVVIGALGPI